MTINELSAKIQELINQGHGNVLVGVELDDEREVWLADTVEVIKGCAYTDGIGKKKADILLIN